MKIAKLKAGLNRMATLGPGEVVRNVPGVLCHRIDIAIPYGNTHVAGCSDLRYIRC